MKITSNDPQHIDFNFSKGSLLRIKKTKFQKMRSLTKLKYDQRFINILGLHIFPISYLKITHLILKIKNKNHL